MLQLNYSLLSKYNWDSVRRMQQSIPAGDMWYIWLILAGRGWGKTRTGAETVRYMITSGLARDIALVGRTEADSRFVMVEGPSGILNVFPKWEDVNYIASRNMIYFGNGAKIRIYSSNVPDQLRGGQHDFAWCDELAAWYNVETTWNNLLMGLRVGAKPRIVVTTTPRFINLIQKLVSVTDGTVFLTTGSTYDNKDNLSPSFLSNVKMNYENTPFGRQEIYAEIVDTSGVRMWSVDNINANRVSVLPTLKKIAIAVDPAISRGHSETGIVVVGIDNDRHCYVLSDLSGTFTPSEWGNIVIRAYYNWHADVIVSESNQGGDLVYQNLHSLDCENVFPYKSVRAIQGKRARAEPVSCLYSQNLIHHYGYLPLLEEQLVTWDSSGKKSDRMDALVWGITELFFNYKTDYKVRII